MLQCSFSLSSIWVAVDFQKSINNMNSAVHFSVEVFVHSSFDLGSDEREEIFFRLKLMQLYNYEESRAGVIKTFVSG